MAYTEQLTEHYRLVRFRLKGTTVPVVRTDLCRPVLVNKITYFPKVYAIPRSRGQLIVDEFLKKKEKHWHEVFDYRSLSKPSLIRNEIWWILRQSNYTLQEICRICRPEKPYNHTTVLHGIRRHQKLLDENNVKEVG